MQCKIAFVGADDRKTGQWFLFKCFPPVFAQHLKLACSPNRELSMSFIVIRSRCLSLDAMSQRMIEKRRVRRLIDAYGFCLELKLVNNISFCHDRVSEDNAKVYQLLNGITILSNLRSSRHFATVIFLQVVCPDRPRSKASSNSRACTSQFHAGSDSAPSRHFTAFLCTSPSIARSTRSNDSPNGWRSSGKISSSTRALGRCSSSSVKKSSRRS